MCYLSRLRFRRALELGVDSHHTYGIGKLGVIATAYYGMTPAPFFTHIGGCGFLGVPRRCLSNPEYQEQLYSGLKYLTQKLKPYGASCYNLGDDTGIRTSRCDQPGCFDRFRDAMRKKYKSIRSANNVWGTDFKRWEELTPETLGKEQTSGNYAPWLDYLYWHEDLYLQVLSNCKKVVNEVDSYAWVGQDASGYANVLDIYVQNNNYVAPYFRRVLIKQLGSFRQKTGFYGSCTGTYTGQGPNPVTMSIPWDCLFAGNNAILFWSMAHGLGGDLTFHPNGYMLKPIAELKRGIGNLFVRAQRLDDGIMLYHSRASKHASNIENRIGYQHLSEDNFSTIVEDLGMQACWTATSRVERGELQKSKPRLLILPYCQALSKKEVKLIRHFVREGGTVLADTRPAVYNFHCRPLKPGALDTLFGIRREPLEDYAVQGELVMTEDLGPLRKAQKITRTIGDRSVKLTTGTARARVADAPAVIINRFGKGRAILLNYFVGRYNSLLDRGQADLLRELYRELFKIAGCERKLTATSKSKDAPGAELVRFRYGGIELLGFAKRALTSENYPLKVQIKLPENEHIYDLRAGAYLGFTDIIRIKCEPMQRSAFALLPYEVKALKLSISPTEVKQGESIKFSAEIQSALAPEEHLIRIDVTGPYGESTIWFRQKLWTKDGRISRTLPLAYNETPGEWKLRATDVLSGKSAEATFKIIRRK